MEGKKIALLVSSLFLLVSILPIFATPDYVIDGNKVYINDSNVYIEAYPHTINMSGYVYFNLTSKVYTGDIDVVWGFNTTEVKPKKAEYYYPHNITRSYTCSGENITYNYTLNPKHFWCYYNYSNNNSGNLIFEHDFETYNVQTKTAYWNETRYYKDITGVFTVKNYEHGGMNKWYYKKNIPIIKNKNYQVRALVYVPYGKNISGKYWFCIKPSSETIHQAISNNHFYCLDPWYSGIANPYNYENFSTYSETDPYNEIEGRNFSAIVTNANEDREHFLYKDFGTGYFENFTMWFEANFTHCSKDYVDFHPIIITDTLGGEKNCVDCTSISSTCKLPGLYSAVIQYRSGGSSYSVNYTCAYVIPEDTLTYWSWKREGTSETLDVYSTAELRASGGDGDICHATGTGSGASYRYIEIGAGLGASSGAGVISSNISYLDLDPYSPFIVAWEEPTSQNKSIFESTINWNVSVSNNATCIFNINGTNYTGTSYNFTTETYCTYQESGLSAGTRCADAYAFDDYGNTNSTNMTICIDIDIVSDNIPPKFSTINITPDDSANVGFQVSPIESSIVTVTANVTIEEEHYNATFCELYNKSGGNLVATNSSPYEITINETAKQVYCSFSMQYYYSSGNYTISINSTDDYGNSGIANETFEYLTLNAFNLSKTTLTYSGNPNQIDIEDFNITNTGNYQSTTQIKGTNLTNSSYSIDVSNLEWGLNDPTPDNAMTTSYSSIGALQILGEQQIYVELNIPLGTMPLEYSGTIYLQSI